MPRRRRKSDWDEAYEAGQRMAQMFDEPTRRSRRRRPQEQINPIGAFIILVAVGVVTAGSVLTQAQSQSITVFICVGVIVLAFIVGALKLMSLSNEHAEEQRLELEAQEQARQNRERARRREAALNSAWLKAVGQLYPERDVSLLPKTPRELDPTKLELLAEQVYRQRGYKTEHTGGAGDGGVDVKVTDAFGQVFIVQCKQYQSRLQPNKIREVRGTLRGRQRGIVWAPGGYTEAAIEEAKRANIELLDEHSIRELIEQLYSSAPAIEPPPLTPEKNSGLPRPVTSGPEQLPPLAPPPKPEWKAIFTDAPIAPPPAPPDLPLGMNEKQWRIVAAMAGVVGVLVLVLIALLVSRL